MSALTCPYCFAAIPRERIAFRCVGRSGRGPGCAPELDERLARYTGSTAAASLPPVFPPPGRAAGKGVLARALRAGAGTAFGGPAFGAPATGAARADCPRCGRPTGRRVCPECHNPLPAAYCDTTGRIVALVGAKNAGKSTYIAVLLHELMNRVGTELDASLVACDDRTIDRFKRDFARPLFDERRLLATTASAATAPREPLVYLLTRTHTTRTGRDRQVALTLVLFDTAGEDLRSRDVTDLHLRYLEAADAIIFLVDPLVLPDGGSTDSDPIDVIARVTEVVSGGRSGSRRCTGPGGIPACSTSTTGRRCTSRCAPCCTNGRPGSSTSI